MEEKEIKAKIADFSERQRGVDSVERAVLARERHSQGHALHRGAHHFVG